MKLGPPPLPSEPSTGELADWAELIAMKKGSIARGNLATAVSRNGGSDRHVADAWNELEARAGLSGTDWTFKVSVTELELRAATLDDTHALAAFCAALGLRQNIDNDHRELFEQCVTEIVPSVVPDSLRLGHPRRPPVDASFREAFREYVVAVDEELKLLPPSSDNDLGMDVVAWRSFRDRRGGYIHFIGQCATGADWEDKLNDLDLEVIKEHVKWAAAPLRFFATPVVVPAQSFRRVSLRAGVVLDRPRLLELESTTTLTPSTQREVLKALAELY